MLDLSRGKYKDDLILNKDEIIELDISYNNLTEIPSFVFECKNLIKLDISNNPIDKLPPEIFILA